MKGAFSPLLADVRRVSGSPDRKNVQCLRRRSKNGHNRTQRAGEWFYPRTLLWLSIKRKMSHDSQCMESLMKAYSCVYTFIYLSSAGKCWWAHDCKCLVTILHMTVIKAILNHYPDVVVIKFCSGWCLPAWRGAERGGGGHRHGDQHRSHNGRSLQHPAGGQGPSVWYASTSPPHRPQWNNSHTRCCLHRFTAVQRSPESHPGIPTVLPVRSGWMKREDPTFCLFVLFKKNKKWLLWIKLKEDFVLNEREGNWSQSAWWF